MNPWTLSEVAECLRTGALPTSLDPNSVITGISTDTRTLKSGSLFVPLVGENFDGHDYLEQAINDGGAAAVVWSRAEVPDFLDRQRIAVFQVADTLQAYQDLGLFHKKKCGVRCVAITGSVGKTTTKEILYHLLSGTLSVHKSEKNYNNDVGVPLTLLATRPEHDVVIVEMGMRGAGEIARLAVAAEPDIGMITSIGTSHLELLGSQEAIALAKSELVEGLTSQGTAVLPESDQFFELMSQRSQAPVLSFSADPSSGGVHPHEIVSTDATSTVFKIDGRQYTLPLPGEHHLHDLMGCLAIGQALGLSREVLLSRLNTLKNPDGRAEWIQLGPSKVYLDCYNSAPESLRAALSVLQRCEGQRVAVLGDMLELGPEADSVHRGIGRELAGFGVDLCLCFGPLSKGLAEAARASGLDARWYSSKDDLASELSGRLRPEVNVLVKASRGMALETIVESLKESVKISS